MKIDTMIMMIIIRVNIHNRMNNMMISVTNILILMSLMNREKQIRITKIQIIILSTRVKLINKTFLHCKVIRLIKYPLLTLKWAKINFLH